MQVSIYLREELLKKLDGVARKESRSRSGVITRVLEGWLRGELKWSKPHKGARGTR
jgi:metal-responsive CopG/Arc/MetJ family transcriptional regulator